MLFLSDESSCATYAVPEDFYGQRFETSAYKAGDDGVAEALQLAAFVGLEGPSALMANQVLDERPAMRVTCAISACDTNVEDATSPGKRVHEVRSRWIARFLSEGHVVFNYGARCTGRNLCGLTNSVYPPLAAPRCVAASEVGINAIH